ncbi:MAG: S41 family peptidase, partial [Bacteroidota bacterium]
VERDREVFRVSPSGGTPVRILDALGKMPQTSPDGRFIAFTRGYGTPDRETYRGSGNMDIWLYDRENGSYLQVTSFDGNDMFPCWGGPRTLYFISALSGRYNVHRMELDDGGNPVGDPQQISRFADGGVRFLSLSADGSTVALERETDIYIMKTDGGNPEKLEINISSDYRFDPFEHKTFSADLSEFAISPNGKYTAFVVRGEIFVTQNDKERDRAVNLTRHPFRDQQVAWLNDSALVFVSDREGQNELYLLRSADDAESDLFKSLKHESVRMTSTSEDESYPVISPDGKKIAYEVGKGGLLVAEISPAGKLSGQKDLLDGWAVPGDVAWSPDSRWLAYSLTDLDFNDEIYIHAADNSREPVNVSMHPRGDFSPVWSEDGTKLGFLSDRNNRNTDVWFVWLTSEDWEKTREEWKEAGGKEDEKEKKSEEEKKSEKKPVRIDFDEMYKRLVQVTTFPGDESNLAISNDGETFYFVGRTNTARGTDLYSVKWDGTEMKALTTGGQSPSRVTLDQAGKHIYYAKKGKLGRYLFKTKETEALPFSAKMTIVYEKEREQIFGEGWRALSDNFYDPNFHGRDWAALGRKYKPWCLKATTQKDFQDMFNLLLGEVNSSHMAMRDAKPRAETQEEKTGLLGIEVEPLEEGLRVKHVVPRSPAEREASRLNVGDLVLSVNGEPVGAGTNFYSLLTNTANQRVLLRVKDAEGETREVVIRPKADLSLQLYDEWVGARQEMVEKRSNGRLGYLHIRGMGYANFEQFERELTARGLGKEGIVVDVRFNGGGWITDYLMTVLNYKQHAYTVPRGATDDLEKHQTDFRANYPLGERLPFAAWIKPSIALCNQNSFSNAEIFSFAYKNLGVGTLVGVPTYGAVISTGARTLMDGSYVRLPGRGWFVLATGENMENGAAVPDIILENSPDARARGTDAQLERAVVELLRQLESGK